MTPDLYAWLKALHVAAAITFVAGVLNVAVILAAAQSERTGMARAVRHWDQRVTTSAMLLVWALGLALAQTGGWFHSGWLLAKLALVVGLSGLHGVPPARLRQLAGGTATTASLHLAAPTVVGCAIAIAILVVVKPTFG